MTTRTEDWARSLQTHRVATPEAGLVGIQSFSLEHSFPNLVQENPLSCSQGFLTLGLNTWVPIARLTITLLSPSSQNLKQQVMWHQSYYYIASRAESRSLPHLILTISSFSWSKLQTSVFKWTRGQDQNHLSRFTKCTKLSGQMTTSWKHDFTLLGI